jgi:hypothetical protein
MDPLGLASGPADLDDFDHGDFDLDFDEADSFAKKAKTNETDGGEEEDEEEEEEKKDDDDADYAGSE